MSEKGWPRDGVVTEWYEGALEDAYACRYPNLTAIFLETLSKLPGKEAFIFPAVGERYTYRQLDDAVKKAAASLIDSGVKKGDRVAMFLLGNPEFIISYLALARIGAVSVIINARLAADEVEYQLTDSGAKMIIAEADLWEKVEPLMDKLPGLERAFVSAAKSAGNALPFQSLLERPVPSYIDVEVDESDIISICYTSGTTGKPNGSIITHRNVVANALSAVSVFPRLLPEGYGIAELREMIALPMFHVTGLHTLFNLAMLGATAVVMPFFAANEVIDAMIAEKCNYFIGVTAMFWLLRMQPNYPDLVKAGHILSMFQGGSPMPPELGKLLLDDFPNAQIGNGFGMTETTSIGAGSILPPDLIIEHGASIGWPTPPTLFKAVDDDGNKVPQGKPGELLISGSGICRGYWNLPDKNAESFVVDKDGRRWHHSGDIVVVDEQGLYTIVDRKKDMVLRGGENIYCVEVENIISMHPKVFQVGVLGVPDAVLGEKVKAVIFPMPGQELTEDEVKDFCRGKLAEYKVPDFVVISPDPLPMNPGGKIMKLALRDM